MPIEVEEETEEGLVLETREDLKSWEEEIEKELEELYNLWIEKGGITEEVENCPMGLPKCIRRGCEFFDVIGNDIDEKSRLGCTSSDSCMRDIVAVSKKELKLLQKQSVVDELKYHLGCL